MAERVVLHIGAPKTGTTFLQAVLFHNQARLAEAGVLVPGRSRQDHGLAATGVRQGPGGRRHGDWQRLVAEARAWPGTVVVSNEWFSMADAEHAARALDDLGDTQKHVVFTARDFVSQVPAAWQETLKLGVSTALEEFVAALDTDRGRWRWSVLDPAMALERWCGGLPTTQAHLVTVPAQGSDPNLLWKRFAQACGIDPDACETQLDRTRESISVESARLLQLAGPAMRDAVNADRGHWNEAYRWIQQYVSHRVLSSHPGGKIRLRPEDQDALRERSYATVKALTTAGYDVVGDLDDLTSSEPGADARQPHEVTDREMLDVAVVLVAELLSRVRKETKRAHAADRRFRDANRGGADGPSGGTERGVVNALVGTKLDWLRRLRPRA